MSSKTKSSFHDCLFDTGKQLLYFPQVDGQISPYLGGSFAYLLPVMQGEYNFYVCFTLAYDALQEPAQVVSGRLSNDLWRWAPVVFGLGKKTNL